MSSRAIQHTHDEDQWLAVRGVRKVFAFRPAPVVAVQHVDLTVRRGSLAAILGPSGCGKSTLLRIIAGIEHQDAGEVWLAGRQLGAPSIHLPPERRDIGIVAQEGALFPHLSVEDNIGFGLRSWRSHPFSSNRRRARKERVQELLDLVGLSGYGRRRPDELSGGQQQRVVLARALAPAPKLVLLDEPFSALDAGLREELRLQVRDLLRRSNTTAILVTHDQEEALSLADQVSVMRDGAVVQTGTPQEIYTRPADDRVARFVADAILLPAHLEQEGRLVANCALGRVNVCDAVHDPGDGACTVMLRPEQVVIDETGIPARVLEAAFYGHGGKLWIALGDDGTGETVMTRFGEGTIPRVGDLVRVRVSGEAVAYASQGSADRDPREGADGKPPRARSERLAFAMP